MDVHPPPCTLPRGRYGGSLARKVVKAQQLWFAILEAQVETGNPYMLYKDAANAKSNQQNLGTIKCSNLCTEIVEFTSPEETAACNPASTALPRLAALLCTPLLRTAHIWPTRTLPLVHSAASRATSAPWALLYSWSTALVAWVSATPSATSPGPRSRRHPSGMPQKPVVAKKLVAMLEHL